MFIISNNKVWAPFSNEFFTGVAPVPTTTGKEYMHWRGGKISIALWQQILAFFLDHRTNEVQVRLFYNMETQQWGAHAFPQRYPSGMTTREIEDHPNMAVDLALFNHPWAYMGTVHHHCGISAFQSSTDHDNEKEIVGIHLTVGKLNDPLLEIHARVCIKFPGEIDEAGKLVRPGTQEFYEHPPLSNWFELPKAAADVLPLNIHEPVIKAMLCTPVGKEVTFPPRWAENLIRFCGPATPAGSDMQWDQSFGGYRYKPGNPALGYWDQQNREAGGVYGRGIGARGEHSVGLRTRDHLVPRGASSPEKTTPVLKPSRVCPPLRTALESGLNAADHDWFVHYVSAVMEPFFSGDESNEIVGFSVDLSDHWQSLDMSSLAEAEAVAAKVGLTKVLGGQWCHPEDAPKITRAIQAALDKERTTLT